MPLSRIWSGRSGLNSSNLTSDGSRRGSVDRKRLEDQVYYHGRIAREELADVFKDDGDFVVRDSVNTLEDQKIVLSVFWKGHGRHFPISSEVLNSEFRFCLGKVSRPTVAELIDFFLESGQTIGAAKVQLKRPIPKDKYQLQHDDVTLEGQIGHGAFGEVWKGQVRVGGSTLACAVKISKDSEELSFEQKKQFMAEARIMKRYDHPNVLKLIGICCCKDPVMIVTELMWTGLDHYFKDHRGESSVADLTKFCVDAASGMEYLAEKKCIHRDLAVRNCLIDKEKLLKISDFGLSREGSHYKAKSGISVHSQLSLEDMANQQLPIRWSAPEALLYGEFSVRSDVWSFGILMYEIFTEGAVPYAEMENVEVLTAVTQQKAKLSPPSNMNQHVALIMSYCMMFEKRARPSFRELHRKLQKEYELLVTTPSERSAGFSLSDASEEK